MIQNHIFPHLTNLESLRFYVGGILGFSLSNQIILF